MRQSFWVEEKNIRILNASVVIERTTSSCVIYGYKNKNEKWLRRAPKKTKADIKVIICFIRSAQFCAERIGNLENSSTLRHI